MDNILQLGADGFKCDGTDPYVMEYSLSGGAMGYNNTEITYKQYADMYYRDFFHYTREKRGGGDAGLIMSRPVDCLLDDKTKLCWGYSPKDVVYSGWVGDDDATFSGLRGCMRKVIYSAWDGYANVGCDVGGYRGDGQLNKQLFIRWAQAMSFLSLMENGGGGEHRPWMYDVETVDIYRKFVIEHHRLAHYFLTIGAHAMDSGTSSITPLATRPAGYMTRDAAGSSSGAAIGENFSANREKDAFSEEAISSSSSSSSPSTTTASIPYPQPSTFSYLIGDNILVHPVLFDDENTSAVSIVDVVFPDVQGQPTTWLDWWKPYDSKLVQQGGGSKSIVKVPLSSYPVYVRCGALIPLSEEGNDDIVLFTWFGPSPRNDESRPVSMDMRQSITDGTGISASFHFVESDSIQGRVSSHRGAGGVHFVGIAKPMDVTIDALPTAVCRSVYDPMKSSLKVTCADMAGGISVKVTGTAPLMTACAQA